ncbi:alkylphosphonate utilization protein [Sulfurospirillum sp. SCADC]|nr:alkylphosphonate utilization protein [Sulfurospirillum sp. SCADC]
MQLPACPKCNCEYTYEDGEMIICPECAHEWSQNGTANEESAAVIKDAHGAILSDGDTVVLIKDLKLKGSSAVIKGGTKVKNIRLNYESDHNLDCKVDGIGAMGLKSEFVKKA